MNIRKEGRYSAGALREHDCLMIKQKAVCLKILEMQRSRNVKGLSEFSFKKTNYHFSFPSTRLHKASLFLSYLAKLDYSVLSKNCLTVSLKR